MYRVKVEPGMGQEGQRGDLGDAETQDPQSRSETERNGLKALDKEGGSNPQRYREPDSGDRGPERDR